MAHAHDDHTTDDLQDTSSIAWNANAFVDEFPAAARIARLCLGFSFTALGVGAIFGIVQALHRTNVFRRFIDSSQYYSVLTGHGVLLALFFTIFFLTGIYTWGTTRSLGRDLPNPRFSLFWFALMLGGAVTTAVTILGGLVSEIPFSADVLYTFYAPLQAHPLFYIGLSSFLVGTWLAGADWFRLFYRWRQDNQDTRIPLQTFMVLVTMLMWYISTLGLAVEVLVFLLPLSLGLISHVDPLLTRTLFWYFGHPVVYFWLLPAYFAWYTLLPKLSGGRLFSDPLARIVFILFLILSTPVGFHHQYADPGIPEGFKFIAMSNTMFLLLPSFLTAFTVVASMEYGARQRGGSGYLGWLKALPWGNPAFAGMALAGLMFAAGGFSGIVNAGMNINSLVHNTLWVPGHFHLTVGTASALTMMAVSYWLYPQVTGKRLQFYGLAQVQPYLWFVGMALMSNAMHRAGLAGVPRRTAEPQYSQFDFAPVVGSMPEMRLQIAAGGTLLAVSAMLFLTVMLGTWLAERGRGRLRVNSHLPEPISGATDGPAVLDNFTLWVAVAVLLVVIAYGVPVSTMLTDGALTPGVPPFPE
ncbi:b(o/a)3-type cytochrome-c oxidase subunit 1 [Halobacterium salinarum]|uniref:b(o/a)3-type cytochrome-c oxidase subunit 1 n=1 Tax=Halobacterium salinarum TaxID=2242 RepID=UPI002554B1AF|nr:b(o/a)3-type cytochrome-c oxidase subunit 1 [Halobacterium salinarum]MDL0128713.1 b(o/a)3-type cytochrome-c oxidase subunit 1 [Halobacterium salinarum]MDL0137412.1 b(o/a)3-type cytochrome-c oxidase subunit 1 [Halobacterium salinarum]MDL0140291.1 b(o/a)3-type cytochrome-c oxidase subunit 1 [Halobacterium salinarum]